MEPGTTGFGDQRSGQTELRSAVVPCVLLCVVLCVVPRRDSTPRRSTQDAAALSS